MFHCFIMSCDCSFQKGTTAFTFNLFKQFLSIVFSILFYSLLYIFFVFLIIFLFTIRNFFFIVFPVYFI